MPARTTPTWTVARLRRVLVRRFGQGPRGGVDVEAAGAAMAVAPRTVQRWLHGSPRAHARIPARRLRQLAELLGPSAYARQAETQAEQYARTAIAGLSLGRGRGILPSWHERRWLEQHVVILMHDPRLDVFKIQSTRDEDERRRIITRNLRVVATQQVPTKFHATLLEHAVLSAVDPWRYVAGDPRQAPTRCWLPDAPRVDLGATWRTIQDTSEES